MKQTLCKLLSLMLFIGTLFAPMTTSAAPGKTLSFLHTEGNRIVDEFGTQLTLRGTNLGSWLMQEGWISPLGAGELSHEYISTIEASCTNGNHSATLAIDTATHNNITNNNLNTFWQSDRAQSHDNMELKLILDCPRTFDRIIVETDPAHTGDYLRGGIVWVSTDGYSDWHQVTGLQIDDSQKSIGRITLKTGEQTARYISVKPSKNSENGQYWSVGNISLCMSDEYNVRTTLFRRFGEELTNSLINQFQSNWITEEDIANIASMNMNFVRVPVYWMDFALQDGTIRTDRYSGFSKIDWLITECNKYGIYILIDFHGAPGGANGWASSGQAGTIPTTLFTGNPEIVAKNQQITLNIWSAIAAKYKDTPTIAAYGLLNEPVLTFSSSDQNLNDVKYAFLNKIYNTVREKDPNHIVVFEEFGDWKIAESRFERSNWTNYMFEKHPYDMSNANSWDSQKQLANNTITTLNHIQNSWNIPLLVGEFCLYYFSDVWDDFLSDLNRSHLSWTNWCYKVRGTKFESGGGNWGYYNSYSGSDPDILHDSYEKIAEIWSNVRTETMFNKNISLINIVSARANGSTNYPYVALDRSNWQIFTTNTSEWNPIEQMKDGNPNTKWSSGTLQQSNQSVTIDLGSIENFDKIELLSSDEDYPGAYKVESSLDGTHYSAVSLNNIDIGFGNKMVLLPSVPQTSRYIRIVLTDSKDKWWAINELNIYWRNVN